MKMSCDPGHLPCSGVGVINILSFGILGQLMGTPWKRRRGCRVSGL